MAILVGLYAVGGIAAVGNDAAIGHRRTAIHMLNHL